MAFALNERTISEPVNGVRRFSAKLTAEDFNAAAVYDNAVTTKGNPLLEYLREFGTNLLIREVTVLYTGTYAGILVKPMVYTSASGRAYLEGKTTAVATEPLGWTGLFIPVRFAEMYHYLVSVTIPTGTYAATDDMIMTIHGEVW